MKLRARCGGFWRACEASEHTKQEEFMFVVSSKNCMPNVLRHGAMPAPELRGKGKCLSWVRAPP